MNDPASNISIPVDLTNPGQFFACCGLLELADRILPKADVRAGFRLHRFENGCFEVLASSDISTNEILKQLLTCSRQSVSPFRSINASDGKPVKDVAKIAPIQIGSPINIRLSWWLDEIAGEQTDLKTWSARQTSTAILNDMIQAIDLVNINDNTVFEQRKGMTGRFGFDRRSAWTAGETGFSPNDQNMPVDTYPAVELLAAIGLQSFKIRSINDKQVFVCWQNLFHASVARAICAGAVQHENAQSFEFNILSRGKFKLFSKSTRWTGSNHG